MVAVDCSFATKRRRTKVPRETKVKIDSELCIGCKACQRVCPTDCIDLIDGKARSLGTMCLACCHCEAACPENAIEVELGAEAVTDFESLSVDSEPLEYGKPQASDLLNLMRSRRSCRNFQDKEVPQELLRDLIRAAVWAPSATNVQQWTFTVIPNREGVKAFVKEVTKVYEEFNRLAGKTILRKTLKFLGRPELDDYYSGYYPFIKKRLKEMAQGGRDVFFRDAPAAIFVCGPKGLHSQDDALLATQNILLTAHAMGLGTCLIGMANAAFRQEPKLRDYLGIPLQETVHSVVALGYPSEKYYRRTKRFEPVIRYKNS